MLLSIQEHSCIVLLPPRSFRFIRRNEFGHHFSDLLKMTVPLHLIESCDEYGNYGQQRRKRYCASGTSEMFLMLQQPVIDYSCVGVHPFNVPCRLLYSTLHKIWLRPDLRAECGQLKEGNNHRILRILIYYLWRYC